MVSDLCKGWFLSLSLISSYINKFLRMPWCMYNLAPDAGARVNKKCWIRPSCMVNFQRSFWRKNEAVVCELTELEVSILMCPTSVLHSVNPLAVIHDTKVMVSCLSSHPWTGPLTSVSPHALLLQSERHMHRTRCVRALSACVKRLSVSIKD